MADEMELADRCVEKLATFRVKELKDVLTQLNLQKIGKKKDLMDRILHFLYDEETPIKLGPNEDIIDKKGIADVIDDVYRLFRSGKVEKTEASGSGTEGGTNISGAMSNEEAENVFSQDMLIRCPCASLAATQSMIQCVDSKCQVKQHISCVIFPEKPTDSVPPLPPKFYCEMCRVKRADPFWETIVHLFYPVNLTITDIPVNGKHAIQYADESFQLTRADRHCLRENDYEVQAWCILLNDSVPFRLQWPQFSCLIVNDAPVRVLYRHGSQLLGANGRDDGALIKLHIKEGVNKVSVSACDSRVFCFGIRLVKRRTVQEVLNLIPKETDGELFEDALARVRRCTGGGMGVANEDSDSDLEVIADSIVVNLRCPLSGSRIKIAGRFKPCAHLGCFDLETFVELSQLSKKWQCPICLKNYSLEDLIIDPYFNRITTMMRDCGEDIAEIDVKPDGSWSARISGESSDLAQWHLPDDSIAAADTGNGMSNMKFSTLIGQAPNNVTVSNGASGSGRDGEKPGSNQDCSGQVDMSTSNGNEVDSVPHNLDPSFGTSSRNFVPSGDANIIVLSDSEEDVPLVSPNPICPTVPTNDNDLNQSLDAGLSSTLNLFHGNGSNTRLSEWPYPSGAHSGPTLPLFGTDPDITDTLTNLQHTSTLAPMSNVDSGEKILNSSVRHTNTDDMDEALIDNPLPFVDNPSLRSFLSTQPPAVSVQSNMEHQLAESNVIDVTNWFSLKLGHRGRSAETDAGANPECDSANNLNLENHGKPKEAASQVDMNGKARFNRATSSKKADGPISYTRQLRSAKRVHLSVDPDSE